MPLYDLKCDACESRRTTYRKIGDRDSLPLCSCGGSFRRVISAPMIQAGFKEYVSPSTGRLIDSPKKERDELRRTGSIIREPGLEKDVQRWKHETQEKAFKPIDDSVETAVKTLVSTGKVSA